jgi:hypothetical protein
MLSEAKRLALLPWVPMGFCASLVLITLVTMFWMMAVNGFSSGEAWSIVFLCNLPLCFMFVGFMTSHLQREIRELREQLVELQKTKVS